jgi:hypothetical protein
VTASLNWFIFYRGSLDPVSQGSVEKVKQL